MNSNSSNLRKITLIIQNMQNTSGFGGDQINGGLIVFKLDMFPSDLFLSVLFLLNAENVLIEEILQGFISVVDTQLFKTVQVEILWKKTNKQLISK